MPKRYDIMMKKEDKPMKQSTKSVLKRILLPIAFTVIYLIVLAVICNGIERSPDSLIDFTSNFAFCYLLMLILTAPPFIMITSVLFWIAELIIFIQYRCERRHLIISSSVCGAFFLIGLLTFIFLTLNVY